MIKKRERYGISMFSIGIVIFLGGIYLMPEKIKVFSAIYIAFLLMCYLFYTNGKVRLYRENVLWCLYCIFGVCSTLLFGIGKIGDALEFIMSVGIGVLASSLSMSLFMCEKQMRSIKIVVFIVLLGCFFQVVVPDLLVKINSVTLGKEQFEMFSEFLLWNHVVGFSYQTGVTAHYLCVFELFVISQYMTAERQNKKKKGILTILFCLGIVLILFTAKRSSLLVVFVVLLAMIVLFNRKHFAKILMAVVGSGLGLWMVLSFTEAGKKMIARTFGDNPFTGRLKIYEILWDMVMEHPVLGNGFGSTLTKVTEFTNGHNIYLQTMAETGIVGIIILLVILIGNLVRAIRVLTLNIKKKEITYIEVFCTGYQIYFITVGLMGNILYDVFPLVLYMITSGIIHSMEGALCSKKKSIVTMEME